MRERIGLVMYGWKLFILFLLFASTFCYAMFQGDLSAGFCSTHFSPLRFMLSCLLLSAEELDSGAEAEPRAV